MNKQVDVLIVGGGLTGALLMHALADSGYRLLLVDAKPLTTMAPTEELDARSLALSMASVRILESLGIWPMIAADACAINTVHVSEKKRFGLTRLHAKPNEPLGYVIAIHHLIRAVYTQLNPNMLLTPAQLTCFDKKTKTAIIHYDGSDCVVEAQLIVGADGAQSSLRQWCNLTATSVDYYQQAIVANVSLARDHHHTAYERFTKDGAIAFLPMTNKRAALIWTMPSQQAQRMQELNDAAFLSALQQAFGYRLGRFKQLGQRQTFPLHQVLMPQQQAWPVVFIGNAAHTLHPIAGQGFNLSLRDVALLAQCLCAHSLKPCALEVYQQSRQHDQRAITFLTHNLIRVFNSTLPGLSFVRGLGLMTVDNMPLFQHWIKRYAGGFAGVIPDLACGLAINKAYGVKKDGSEGQV